MGGTGKGREELFTGYGAIHIIKTHHEELCLKQEVVMKIVVWKRK